VIIGSKSCEYSEAICTGCETATVEIGTCASGGSDSIACRTGYSRSPAAAVICGNFKIICGSLQGLAALILLMYANWEQLLLHIGDISAVHPVSAMMFAVPWLFFLCAELLSLILLLRLVHSLRRYRNTHLSPDDIKEALDWLPAAVCIADEDGTVLLSNLAMNDLAQRITSHPLTDLRRLWETVTAQGE
jgi:hypothetical protein